MSRDIILHQSISAEQFHIPLISTVAEVNEHGIVGYIEDKCLISIDKQIIDENNASSRKSALYFASQRAGR